MKNKRIIDSWNKIEPDSTAEARMLNAILDRKHLGEPERRKVIKMSKTFNWKRLAPVAACLVLAVAIAIPFINNSSSDFDLPLSDEGIKVSYVDKVPNSAVSDLLVYLTEDELLADLYAGYPVAIFSGTIIEVKNIQLDFSDGSDNYRAIAKIKVEDVLRGVVEAGETVSVLLPAPVGVKGVEIEDTGISSQMVAGVTGIFTPMKYNETSIWKQSDKEIHLLDLASYGLPDGERWAFLETANGLQYDHEAYPSLAGAKSINDVKEFIFSKIE